jgi:hypothetical protein
MSDMREISFDLLGVLFIVLSGQLVRPVQQCLPIKEKEK